MANSIYRFFNNSKAHPQKIAIADISQGVQTFEDIRIIGARAQEVMNKYKINAGDAVLVAITPSPTLYGTLTGLIGLGVKIIVIEPWLSLSRIDHIIQTTKPKAFLTSTIGKLWGLRSKEIRNIAHWITDKEILRSSYQEFKVKDVADEHPAFIVFSSGTTGLPKGVLRTHGYLEKLYLVLDSLEEETYQTPDLILFPSVALYHLGTGRGSVLIPRRWSQKNINKLIKLCQQFRPETVSASPGFLKKMLKMKKLSEFSFLKRVVIGGALCDCPILQEAFASLPHQKFVHIYGSSEAEPVSLIDAKIAVEESIKRGYFQTLCLGKIIAPVKTKSKDNVLWVSGPNVAGEYIGEQELNRGIKERDESGVLWHCMGDRVNFEGELAFYGGREKQSRLEFEIEQKAYVILGHSKAFLHRTPDQKFILVGEEIKSKWNELKQELPQIDQFIESSIHRDPRHRSRIDRVKSVPKKYRI